MKFDSASVSRVLSILFGLLLTIGCANKGADPADPWEGLNRKMYSFNKAVDTTFAKPLTKGYKAVTPDFMETGISNVFSNLGDIPNFLNNLFQGKPGDSVSDLSRFLINSTLGIAGLWDPATSMGFAKHDEDFGQTLAAWGAPDGPYVMLPFFGPSTLRDAIASPVDSEMSLLSYIEHVPTRNQIKLLELVDQRSGLLAFESQLESATDEYAFVRDAYLQNRKFKVYDGRIPFEDDFECEEEEDCDF